MEVIWTGRASANLDFFKAQIRDQSGSAEVADKFYEKVVLRADRLLHKPDWIGIPVKEYPGAGYKSLFVMDYRIVFRVDCDVVYIVTFLHKRMIIEGRI
jgi:mRNA-degrading endonuclease RelE of RelBE toxin-antitoxin system